MIRMITSHQPKNLPFGIIFTALLPVALLISSFMTTIALAWNGKQDVSATLLDHATFVETFSNSIYLPVIIRPGENFPNPRINIPFFQGEIKGAQTAVTWFGQVTPVDNYADVRIGYNPDKLWVRVSVIDRRLWYDPRPSLEDLTEWDAVSLYLKLDENAYRFDAQLNWWEARDKFQAGYQASGDGWTYLTIPFETRSRWWGFPQPNDERDDRAWAVAFSIPFESLGLSGMPEQGTEWRLGVQIHDRDDAAGTPIPTTAWPPAMEADQPATWGRMHFGLPAFNPPQATVTHTITIRNGLDGKKVVDGVVGGNTTCGGGIEFWSEWGEHSYAGERHMNVQNQGNTDDWPCFSRFYITFPLDSLPAGKAVISASLTLHQSGQSTGFTTDPPEALNSLIQIMEVAQDWDESTLSWNNAPIPIENVSQAWVGYITMEDLGKAYNWDVGRSAGKAYASGEPLRLALYSADAYGPNGKYFFSSDETWQIMRPSLTVELGDTSP
jgi:hypothetical protein